MGYVGILTQQRRNNTRSVLLLLGFPCIILAMLWGGLALFVWIISSAYSAGPMDWGMVNEWFMIALPWVIGGVALWFVIAYFYNSSIIHHATHARPLERKENMRVYNIVENLCMSVNMPMPQVYVVDDPQLNAFASGINDKTYAVTVTTGLLNTLNDEELEGVIAHELTHIRNRDTRVLITSIVFVGIISTLMAIVWRVLWVMVRSTTSSSSRNKKDSGAGIAIIALLIGVVCLAIGWVFTTLTRFAVSRKREYMADAGGAELSGNPLALASALRKISGNPGLASVKRDDVAQLFIALPAKGEDGGNWFSKLFATHPPIEERIEILEQF